MRVLVIFFIFLFSTITKSEEVICKGFCENEEYIFAPSIVKSKSHFLTNGKWKKIKSKTIHRGVSIKNSSCLPFYSYIELRPNLWDKKKVVEAFYSHYAINACGPCTDELMGIKRANPKHSFCSLPLYSLNVYHGVKEGIAVFPAEGDEIKKSIKVGREKDVTRTLLENYLLSNTVMEEIILSTSSKTDITFFRIITKDTNEYAFGFFKSEYKTAAKQQIIKQSDNYQLLDEETIKFLENFIDSMQSTFTNTFLNNHKDFFSKQALLNLLPDIKMIKMFENYTQGIAEHHIQRRN